MTTRRKSHRNPPRVNKDASTRVLEDFLHAHSLFSDLSPSTRARWRKQLQIPLDYTVRESQFLHGLWIAAAIYQGQVDKCFAGKADMMVGALSMSLTECLLLMEFFLRKEAVARTKAYRTKARSAGSATRGGVRKKRIPFLNRLSGLPLETLFAIAKEIKLLEDSDLTEFVKARLKKYGYPADLSGLLKFLRSTRTISTRTGSKAFCRTRRSMRGGCLVICDNTILILRA